MYISVITPTYNRAYILPQCYDSLKSQTSKDFEWIVVDDGSTDNTEEIVKGFIEDNVINITYIKQENGGKHRAHNTGVKAAHSILSVCLDSDDALTVNAIETVIVTWNNLKYEGIIGILALRGDFKKHEPICSSLPQNVAFSTMSNLRDNYAFEGDTVLFFKTSVLKDHLFREFSGETFLPEFNLYDELDKLGEMLLLDNVLYLCEYLPDGLTAKYHNILLKNPKGSADTYYRMSISAKSFWLSLKYAIISQSYLTIVEDREELKDMKWPAALLLAKLFVPILKNRYIK